MSKNPANRGIGDHLKEGLKNIPKSYKTLYTPSNAKEHVKIIAKGRIGDVDSDKVPLQKRAKLLGLGAMSVTPLGPIAAFGAGIKGSVDKKNKAIEDKKTYVQKSQQERLDKGEVVKTKVASKPETPQDVLNRGGVIKTNVPSKPVPPKVNEFKKPLGPSNNVQPGVKNMMGNNRKPPTKK